MANESLRGRIESSIERDPVFGCWIWTGRPDRDGYGTLWGRTGPRQAHRAAYVELVGPVADGLVLDHLCRRRRCVRPAHIEPITGAENDLRRSWGYRCRRTTCPRGHALGSAIVTPEGGRLCRTCMGPERPLDPDPCLASPEDPTDPELAAIASIYDAPGARRR